MPSVCRATAVAEIAPTIVIPEIAFVPDISGVCSCDGTFEISSMPRNPAITNTKTSSNISPIAILLIPLESFVYYLSALC